MNLTVSERLRSGQDIKDIPLRVTFYARVSTEKEEQLNALNNQIDINVDEIENNPNWTYVEGYVDEGISGTSTIKRDNFNKMIADAKNKKFDLIIVKELSRFSRSLFDSIKFIHELQQHDVGVYITNLNVCSLKPSDKLIISMFATMAEQEVDRISERVQAGQKRAIKNGRVLGNNEIWGYDKDNGKLVINEEEAKMIRTVFEVYSTGKIGFHTLSKQLDKQGFTNRNGNSFSYSTLVNIIRNPKYKGFYCGGKTETIDYRNKKRKVFNEKDWVMYKDNDNIPPIVSEELWKEANRILDLRSGDKRNREIYQNRYLFSGKIICSKHDCAFHRTVYKYKTKEDQVVFQCAEYRKNGKCACDTPTLYEEELLRIIRLQIDSFILNKQSLIYSLLERYRTNINKRDFTKELNKLGAEVDKIEKRKNKLLDLSINDHITNQEFKIRNDKLNEELNSVYNEINNIEKEQTESQSLDEKLNHIEALLTKKLSSTNEELLAHLIRKIVVVPSENGNKFKLKLYYTIGITEETDYHLTKPHHNCSHVSYDSC